MNGIAYISYSLHLQYKYSIAVGLRYQGTGYIFPFYKYNTPFGQFDLNLAQTENVFNVTSS